MNRSRFRFLTTLVLLAAASRLIPHPPNFAPLAAVALFGGATIERRWLALLVPLAALLLSDLLLQVTYLSGLQSIWGFYQGQWVGYACFLVTASIGFLIRRRPSLLAISLATLAGSLIFFLVTNFAVWANGLMYPKTAPGLLPCYEMAVPFFRFTLEGDIIYSVFLFGVLTLEEEGFPLVRQSASARSRACV